VAFLIEPLSALGPGIYHGMLNVQSTTSDIIDAAALLPYPVSSSSRGPGSGVGIPPLSVALTQYHFLALYRDKVCAIRNLDDRMVWEEVLPLVRLYIPLCSPHISEFRMGFVIETRRTTSGIGSGSDEGDVLGLHRIFVVRNCSEARG
jgi:hypothetical protein